MTFYWDFVLRLYRFLFPGKAFEFYNKYCKGMSRQGFALISTYTGLRLEVDSALREQLPPTFVLVSNHQSLYDILLLYGRRSRLDELDDRPAGPEGDRAHEEAVADQEREAAAERAEYERLG